MTTPDRSFAAVMARKHAIMKASMGMDFDDFSSHRLRLQRMMLKPTAMPISSASSARPRSATPRCSSCAT
jgi:hypothetical protein